MRSARSYGSRIKGLAEQSLRGAFLTRGGPAPNSIDRDGRVESAGVRGSRRAQELLTRRLLSTRSSGDPGSAEDGEVEAGRTASCMCAPEPGARLGAEGGFPRDQSFENGGAVPFTPRGHGNRAGRTGRETQPVRHTDRVPAPGSLRPVRPDVTKWSSAPRESPFLSRVTGTGNRGGRGRLDRSCSPRPTQPHPNHLLWPRSMPASGRPSLARGGVRHEETLPVLNFGRAAGVNRADVGVRPVPPPGR